MAARQKMDAGEELAKLQRDAEAHLDFALCSWGAWVRRNNRLPGVNAEGWPSVSLLYKMMQRPMNSTYRDETTEDRVDRAVRVQQLLNADPRPAAALFARYAFVPTADDRKTRSLERAQYMTRLVRQSGSKAACGRDAYLRALAAGREYVRGFITEC